MVVVGWVEDVLVDEASFWLFISNPGSLPLLTSDSFLKSVVGRESKQLGLRLAAEALALIDGSRGPSRLNASRIHSYRHAIGVGQLQRWRANRDGA